MSGRAAACASTSQGGFTLIELAVALALLSLMSLVLFESLRFAQRSYDRVVRKGATSWELFAGQRLIRSIIESAYPQQAAMVGASAFGFAGNRDRIVVVAAAPLAGAAGLYRYEISLQRRDVHHEDLLVRWQPDYAISGSVPDAIDVGEEVLIPNVAAIEWQYLEGPGESGGSVPVWRSEWHDRRTLPQLVRMRVQFPPGDARRWPELVAAPRITDDANCVFDPIARRCRTST